MDERFEVSNEHKGICGKLTAKLRDAVPVCFMVNDTEVKRYKNKMEFKTDITEKEYLRDAYYRNTPDLAEDVLAEQAKINASDAIVFIYPVFWSEAPAKLVGWFDRVWSYGFAYGEKTMKTLEKGLILCSAGNPKERLEEFGVLDSMKKVMLGDRLFGRVKQAEFVVFDNTSRENELREKNRERNLRMAYEKGKNL